MTYILLQGPYLMSYQAFCKRSRRFDVNKGEYVCQAIERSAYYRVSGWYQHAVLPFLHVEVSKDFRGFLVNYSILHI